MQNDNSNCFIKKSCLLQAKSVAYTLNEENTTNIFHFLAAMHWKQILELLLRFNMSHCLTSPYLNINLSFTCSPLLFVLLSSPLISKLHCGQSQIALPAPKTLQLANSYRTKEPQLPLTTFAPATTILSESSPVPLASLHPSSHIT